MASPQQYSPGLESSSFIRKMSVSHNSRGVKDWEIMQKKTFTNWKYGNIEAIQDIDTELGSGEKLIQLLEIIGNDKLGKYSRNPRMRIQKVENQNIALEFVRKRGVILTNIGAEDLVDGNSKLLLGLIWSLILRFTISDITEEGLSAKEGLLLWTQKRTAPYKDDIAVKDFTVSWKSGLALPDLLDYQSLNKDDAATNIKLAFEVAEEHLNIPKLFAAEDILNVEKPDERSIMTYVAQYFHAFSASDRVGDAGRRLEKFGAVMSQGWMMQNDFQKRLIVLKENMQTTQQEWESAVFANYPDAKKQLVDFESYKSSTKRRWVMEKRDLESVQIF